MNVVKKEDYESLVVTLSLAAVIALLSSFVAHWRASDIALPSWAPIGGKERWVNPMAEPARHVQQARMAEVQVRFQQGVMMLHAKDYEHALTAFHKVLELSPRLPEAHSNMGYALLGLEEYGAAGDFFATAIELRPNLATAYYGLGMALGGLQDYEGAMGAMRTYIHLSDPKPMEEQVNDPYLRKARAALWEWEQKLGRSPPAPTAGVASFADRDRVKTPQAAGGKQ
ncbi:MAG: hypothetical protein A2V90_06625 [Gammaproteobacteria bacterium RBG_16_57_12]|nr:MAG: hypothetical protein A2V90_06625 [Gammaproteobacteria bacterium RBG_16_57_12]